MLEHGRSFIIVCDSTYSIPHFALEINIVTYKAKFIVLTVELVLERYLTKAWEGIKLTNAD